MFWEGHKKFEKIFYLDLILRKDLKDFGYVLTKIAGKMKQNLFDMASLNMKVGIDDSSQILVLCVHTFSKSYHYSTDPLLAR